MRKIASFFNIKNINFQIYHYIDGFIAIAFLAFCELNTYFWAVSSAGKLLREIMAEHVYYDLVRIMSYSHIQAAKDWASLISALPADFIPVVVILIILAVRKQSIRSLGFQKKHNIKAALIGITAGILTAMLMCCVLFFCGKPNVFNSLLKPRAFAFELISCIICTGLTEELSFRAYLQSRIIGLIKNQWIAVIVVGLMFWVSHFFNDFLNGPVSITDLLIQGVDMVCTHILYLFLYKKTGNILTAAFCHGIYDFMISPIYF